VQGRTRVNAEASRKDEQVDPPNPIGVANPTFVKISLLCFPLFFAHSVAPRAGPGRVRSFWLARRAFGHAAERPVRLLDLLESLSAIPRCCVTRRVPAIRRRCRLPCRAVSSPPCANVGRKFAGFAVVHAPAPPVTRYPVIALYRCSCETTVYMAKPNDSAARTIYGERRC